MAKPTNTALAVISQDVDSLGSSVDYTREQIQLIKDTYAKGATDAELRLFIEIAKRKGLDIFSKQICLVGRWDSKLGKEVKDPQTTIDGYRLIAERTGRYVPGRDTLYTYKIDSETLLCATAFVKKLAGGEWHEIAATAFFDEYVQTKKDGTPNTFWKNKPHLMLAKCAESLALRKAFPAELSGLYTQEEMGGEIAELHSPAPVAQIAPPIEEPTPRQPTAEDLVDFVEKVEGGYEVMERDEIHSVTRNEGKVVCTCDAPQPCIHRIAVGLYVEQQRAVLTAIPERVAEPIAEESAPQFQDEAHAAAFDAQAPVNEVLKKAELISVCGLTTELEKLGVAEEEWRKIIERVAGTPSRKQIARDDFAKVMHALSREHEAAEQRAQRKVKKGGVK